MKKLSLIILGCSIYLISYAQEKKSMDHSIYENWRNIGDLKISDQGDYVAYEVRLQRGDGFLCIYEQGSGITDTIDRAYKMKFIPGGTFIAGGIKPPYDLIRQSKKEKNKKNKDEMPDDSLFIYNLESDQIEIIGNIGSFSVPERNSSWIVYQHAFKTNKEEEKSEKGENVSKKEEEKGNDPEKAFKVLQEKYKASDLVIYNPVSGKRFNYHNVLSYALGEEGKLVAFRQLAKDSVLRTVVYTFSLDDEQLHIVFDDAGMSDQLTIDKTGKQLGFIYHPDPDKSTGYSLHHWKYGEERPQILLDSIPENIPEGWGINKNGKLHFSGDGKRLYFGTSPIPAKLLEDSLLDEEKPQLDVWSWHDEYLQPQQKKRLKEEQKKNYLAYYDLERSRAVQLADEKVERVVVMHEGSGDHMLGFAMDHYGPLVSWEGLRYKDIYLINPLDGNKKLILEKKAGNVILSPFGNYVVYYSLPDSGWFSYHISTGEKIDLTEELPANFFEEDDDRPQYPGSYGSLGFTEDDEFLLIYDRFDIWKIDPSGEEKAINLTRSWGRDNQYRLRYRKLDPNEWHIDLSEEMILSVFDLKSMKSGYARFIADKDKMPEMLVFSDHTYQLLLKAENATVYAFRKGDFRNYPDLYLADEGFRKVERISDINPQEQDYWWGDVQLVSWNSFNNEALKGLLYTPEDFDPEKKYPMLVYFYETSSHTKNFHRIPSPSRSIINIPWCTSNGYVVFVPDITYRDGYPGQSAYDAVVSGTMAMTERYDFIDEDRMGIQGQSWGGYQVAWLVTQTNLYAAAMAGAPVSNMTSAYGGIRWGSGMSRMFQYERTQSRIGGTLWDKLPLYMENSPVFHAPKIETPLLIMHNDNDGAVPWYQGIELFVAMRRLQKPAWMLTYNDEEHNLTKWPNRVDLSIRMMQFFDHYLKGEPAPKWMIEGIPAALKGRNKGYELLDQN